MKLKCIGGELDGKFWEVAEHYRVHDYIKIPKYPMSTEISLSEMTLIPDTVVAQEYVYKISCFHFSKEVRYLFLIPQKWTNEQAIRHQFNK